MQTLIRRLNEVGKIRIGCQVPIEQGRNTGKPRPERLKHFRLTSNSLSALRLASATYGGEVQPWRIPPEWKDLPQMRTPDHQFELYTTTDTLNVLMRGDSLLDTSFEMWDGAYCARRCDGEYILHDGHGALTGMECQCPSDPEQRKALAAQGKACLAVSRIAVLLEGMPVGQWRLDTRGDNTPAEVRGLQDMLAGCQVSQAVLKATMRLEFRTSHVMRQGQKQTHHYSCVVIEPCYTAEDLLIAGQRQAAHLLSLPDETTKALPEHIADLTGDLPTVHPLWAQMRHLYSAAGRVSEYAAFETWALRRVPGAQTLADIPAAQVEALFARVKEKFFIVSAAQQRQEEAQKAEAVSQSTPLAETNLGDPGQEKTGLSSSAWRDTLIAHMRALDDLAVDDDDAEVRELAKRCGLALRPDTADSEGLACAAAVLDVLENKEVGR